jgi:hypothetical protein
MVWVIRKYFYVYDKKISMKKKITQQTVIHGITPVYSFVGLDKKKIYIKGIGRSSQRIHENTFSNIVSLSGPRRMRLRKLYDTGGA